MAGEPPRGRGPRRDRAHHSTAARAAARRRRGRDVGGAVRRAVTQRASGGDVPMRVCRRPRGAGRRRRRMSADTDTPLPSLDRRCASATRGVRPAPARRCVTPVARRSHRFTRSRGAPGTPHGLRSCRSVAAQRRHRQLAPPPGTLSRTRTLPSTGRACWTPPRRRPRPVPSAAVHRRSAPAQQLVGPRRSRSPMRCRRSASERVRLPARRRPRRGARGAMRSAREDRVRSASGRDARLQQHRDSTPASRATRDAHAHARRQAIGPRTRARGRGACAERGRSAACTVTSRGRAPRSPVRRARRGERCGSTRSVEEVRVRDAESGSWECQVRSAPRSHAAPGQACARSVTSPR
jgi:hypothetical protein